LPVPGREGALHRERASLPLAQHAAVDAPAQGDRVRDADAVAPRLHSRAYTTRAHRAANSYD
jgi:hypothetical protein